MEEREIYLEMGRRDGRSYATTEDYSEMNGKLTEGLKKWMDRIEAEDEEELARLKSCIGDPLWNQKEIQRHIWYFEGLLEGTKEALDALKMMYNNFNVSSYSEDRESQKPDD